MSAGVSGYRRRSLIAALMALVVSIAALLLPFARPAVADDDYPWPGTDPNAVSPLGFNYRNCTDFVAWRLNEHLGTRAQPFAFTWWSFVGAVHGNGDAIGWKQDAISEGYLVDSSPVVGSVAWWGGEVSAFGHIAMVTAVNGDGTVNVEEYNARVPYGWDARQGLRADAYLHIADTPPPTAPIQLDSVAAVRNPDGRLEVFGVNSRLPDGENNIVHSWQTTPGGSWSAWSPLPGYLTNISVAVNGDGRLEVFGVNAHQPDGQNNVYHMWQFVPGGNWSPWAVLPGYLTSVAAITAADGRVEVEGANAHIPDGQANFFHSWQNTPAGNWTPWYSLPGHFTSVGAAINGDGRLETFGVNEHQPDGQNNVYHMWQFAPGGGWSPWAVLPGYLTSIAATTGADGRVEVEGANAHIPAGHADYFHSWQNTPGANWTSWSALEGHLTSVGAATNRDGRLEAFGADATAPSGQNNVWHIAQLTPAGGWGDHWIAMSG